MRISVFGMGYVGVVSGACLAKQGHTVIGIDTNTEKLELLSKGISPIVEHGIAELVAEVVASNNLSVSQNAEEAIIESDISFISVGTPSAENGSLFLHSIEAVTREIGRALKKKKSGHTVVYRSTMLPGTTENYVIPLLEETSGRSLGNDLQVCFNPEFLREGSSIKDFFNPPLTILGASSDSAALPLIELYSFLNAELVVTSIPVAESVKYLSNVYHALKIVFANEAGSILKSAGVDSREALEIFCKDRALNISEAYLRPGFAFGGSCLPKDTRAFLHLAKSLDVEVPMLSSVLGSNNLHIERAQRIIEKLGHKKIALYGLAFKGGTDDLRESPIVTLAEHLIGRGFELSIYDVNVNTSRLIGANKAFIEKEIPHIDRLLCDSPKAALEGAELIVLANIDEEAILAVELASPQGPIVDLQGVPSLDSMPGADYYGICW